MNIQRRLLLKSMVLGGISSVGLAGAGTGLTGDSIESARSMPILVLVNDRTRHSAFLQGVRAAAGRPGLPQVHDTDLGLDSLLTLQRYIQRIRGRLIVGLVNDASGTIIVDLARTTGVRMYWLGQHTASLSQSRHQLLSSQITDNRKTWFDHRLVSRNIVDKSEPY